MEELREGSEQRSTYSAFPNNVLPFATTSRVNLMDTLNETGHTQNF